MARVSVSAEDIATYQRDGAVLLKGVLDPAALQLLETGVEEVHRNLGKRFTAVGSSMSAGKTVVREYVSQDSPALSTLLQQGIVGELGAALMQTSSAQLILDQVFYKTQGPIVATPWHQDTPFLRARR
jgi:hypothetical protein